MVWEVFNYLGIRKALPRSQSSLHKKLCRCEHKRLVQRHLLDKIQIHALAIGTSNALHREPLQQTFFLLSSPPTIRDSRAAQKCGRFLAIQIYMILQVSSQSWARMLKSQAQ